MTLIYLSLIHSRWKHPWSMAHCHIFAASNLCLPLEQAPTVFVENIVWIPSHYLISSFWYFLFLAPGVNIAMTFRKVSNEDQEQEFQGRPALPWLDKVIEWWISGVQVWSAWHLSTTRASWKSVINIIINHVTNLHFPGRLKTWAVTRNAI